MKKQFISLIILSLFAQISFVYAQKSRTLFIEENEDEPEFIPAYNQESTYFSLGYGFGSYYRAFRFNNDQSIIGPLYLKIEKPVSDRFGIGFNMAYSNLKITENSGYYNGMTYEEFEEKINVNIFSILARLNWHYGNFKDFDPYMGFGMGYRMVQSRYIQKSPFNNSGFDEFGITIPFGFDFTIGARYFISPQVGVYTEFGVAQSVGQFGICARF